MLLSNEPYRYFDGAVLLDYGERGTEDTLTEERTFGVVIDTTMPDITDNTLATIDEGIDLYVVFRRPTPLTSCALAVVPRVDD